MLSFSPNRKLQELGINSNLLDAYYEPHRFYHNHTHIWAMLEEAEKRNILTDDLFLAIVFHDIVYDPKKQDNEENSARLFLSFKDGYTHVAQAILNTKTHKPTSELSKQLCDLDLSVLYSDYKTFIDFEHKIFKEYQWVDYKTYVEKRVEILANLGVSPEYINYVKYRQPKIGVYAGSFNPFHKGHLNILEKAEQIFDKVIIARGLNPEKLQTSAYELPSSLQYHQIEHYSGLLTDFIDKLNYPDLTLIRGLRNSTDLQYEQTQYRFLQDLNPDIKIVSIFCDKEYEHISSSAIRTLEKYGKHTDYLL